MLREPGHHVPVSPRNTRLGMKDAIFVLQLAVFDHEPVVNNAMRCPGALGRLDPRRLHEVEGEHAHAIARRLLANGDLEVRA